MSGDATTRVYKALKLNYSSDADSAQSGIIGSKRGVDLTELNELAEEGWRVRKFATDEDGCWQEAMLVKEVES